VNLEVFLYNFAETPASTGSKAGLGLGLKAPVGLLVAGGGEAIIIIIIKVASLCRRMYSQ